MNSTVDVRSHSNGKEISDAYYIQWQGDMFPLPNVSGQVLAGSLVVGNDVSPCIQSGSDMVAKPHGMTTTASSSNLKYQLVIIGRSTCGRHGPAQFQV